MKEKINETVLSILKKDDASNKIEIDYIEIVNTLSDSIENICILCDNQTSTIDNIISYIKTTSSLNQLDGQYRYCEKISAPYQGFNVKNLDYPTEIISRRDVISKNKKDNPDTYDEVKYINFLKNDIKYKYELWGRAFAIEKAYNICKKNKKIILHSHRSCGWSNPVYSLTPNFSIEIKTNFGYGGASYFYTKMKYKNIEITPFSEWITYEFAKFDEIIRYTREHGLRNEYWLEAMEFSRDACNLSMTDEVKFVEKYVIEECEAMISGLEEIFNKSHFNFKSRDRSKYSVDKAGHILMEFRGEKISGALDFISQILEFEKITEMKSFIDRIEKCNKEIHPGLLDELKEIKIEIESLTYEISDLKPKHDRVVAKNGTYVQNKRDLQYDMIKNGKLDKDKVDINRLSQEFNFKYPEYKEFEKEYKIVTESFRKMNEKLKNTQTVHDKIVSHVAKIDKYFGFR